MCSVGAGSIPIELSFVCCELDVDGKDDIALIGEVIEFLYHIEYTGSAGLMVMMMKII